MASNKGLNQANKQKKDEFYTQLSDIEHELRHYRVHFRGKTVLCNCDDPRVSNFFRYFAFNFEALGLRRLITTCYKNQEPDLFSMNTCERAIWLEYLGDTNGNRVPDPDEIGIRPLQGDGDFRSPECVALLKQADSDVQCKKGIYAYVLDGDEHHLELRAFDDNTRRTVYERQQGLCPNCGKHFELGEMHADHILPWSKGGHTVEANCQLLCRTCNLRKGAR